MALGVESLREPEVLQLTSYVVSVDPKISVVPNFLSADECGHMIAISEKVGFVRSQVGRGVYTEGSSDVSEGLKNQYSENRTSCSVTFEPCSDYVMKQIELRLAALVGLPVEQLESLVVVKYEPGQQFKQHHDGKFRPYTVFLYLNDIPSGMGGETRFPELNLRVRPSEGTAVVWRNASIDPTSGEIIQDDRLVHEGLPPSDGWTKYGVNCFFNFNIMRH